MSRRDLGDTVPSRHPNKIGERGVHQNKMHARGGGVGGGLLAVVLELVMLHVLFLCFENAGARGKGGGRTVSQACLRDRNAVRRDSFPSFPLPSALELNKIIFFHRSPPMRGSQAYFAGGFNMVLEMTIATPTSSWAPRHSTGTADARPTHHAAVRADKRARGPQRDGLAGPRPTTSRRHRTESCGRPNLKANTLRSAKTKMIRERLH